MIPLISIILRHYLEYFTTLKPHLISFDIFDNFSTLENIIKRDYNSFGFYPVRLVQSIHFIILI